MTAGPKAAVDGASLPPAARSAGAGILQPTLVISHGAVLDETLRDVGRDEADEIAAQPPGRGRVAAVRTMTPAAN